MDTATSATSAAGRPRDADNTRERLLAAARHRFARDGYTATTVREIATDAGVNVALINRYFSSKEGLFEACVTYAGEQLSHPSARDVTVEGIVATMLRHIIESPSGEPPVQLMLLLQTSRDDRADSLRRTILQTFAERMAEAAGWQPGEPDSDAILLRAEIALAAALGIVLMRSTTGLSPLGTASEDELSGPLSDVLSMLLSAPKSK